MPSLPPSETFYGLFSGLHVGLYLEAFSQHKLFSGKTIKDRIMFGSKAQRVTKAGKRLES
jgi:dimethylaniline monooxygenase (N-oxide forming)